MAVYDDEDHFRQAMMAGASGYVMKDSPPSQIVTAAREIFGAPTSGHPRESHAWCTDLHALARANERWARSTLLTPRENEVLKLFAEGGTARQIAAELDLSIKTVEAHKFNLMRKLDVHNRHELINLRFNNVLSRCLLLLRNGCASRPLFDYTHQFSV